MTCYTREIVYDVLEKVLIRNEEQREYKIKNYKKPDNAEHELREKQHNEINEAILNKFK
jgi:hypothetical protein